MRGLARLSLRRKLNRQMGRYVLGKLCFAIKFVPRLVRRRQADALVRVEYTYADCAMQEAKSGCALALLYGSAAQDVNAASRVRLS
jgi:hypothetical protein